MTAAKEPEVVAAPKAVAKGKAKAAPATAVAHNNKTAAMAKTVARKLPKVGDRILYRGAVIRRTPDGFKIHIGEHVHKDNQRTDYHKKIAEGSEATEFNTVLKYVDDRVE